MIRENNYLTFLQAPSQAHPELLVESLRLSALDRGLLWRHAHTLQEQVLAVTLERVPAHEKITSVVANGDLEWVRLHGIRVVLEFSPYLESNTRAEAAVDR
jgi:hypothetical protein